MKIIRQLLPSLLCTALAQTADAQTGSELVDEYCIGCHNTEDWAGSLALDTMNAHAVAGDAESWEKVIRKLGAGMMPPGGQPRPSTQASDALISTLEARLDAAAVKPPPPPAVHRLNRNEYANAIRDILGLELDISMMLPLDNASEGFDNLAAGLGSSPALIQAYASAAMKIARQAIGDSSTSEQAVTFLAPEDLQHDRHLEGMPLGTRGGLRVTYRFPLDATYEFSVRGGFRFGRNFVTQTHITMDGVTIKPNNTGRFRIPVSAGEHTMTFSTIDLQRSAGVNDIYSEFGNSTGISRVDIHGPFNATDTGDTRSRRMVFSCYPQSNDEETACARQILSGLASKAFRTPLHQQAPESVMQYFERGRQQNGFEYGIQLGLSRILADPRFLFRFEEQPAGLAEGLSFAISDLELASRLSFFLWSSIPDTTLLNLADEDSLDAALPQQVSRMLQDPRAEALLDNFASQWLQLRQLETLTPETDAFNDNLREAFIQETRLLFGHIISEDLPVTELINASYTFLNERLAKHYGIDDVYGDYFRQVELPEDSPRRGLLGQASMLTVTSTASRTSPVIRGSWILDNLLHTPVPAPPPGVETNLDGDGSVVLSTSIRERLEQHRQDPTCSSCHSIIDPVGFALENFDMIGGWREKDGDSAVDSSGTLVDGTQVRGAADLRKALMKKKHLFVSTFIEKLLTYAIGRKLEYYDMPIVRDIRRQAEQQNYRFSAIVQAITSSDLFLERTVVADSAGQHTVAQVTGE